MLVLEWERDEVGGGETSVVEEGGLGRVGCLSAVNLNPGGRDAMLGVE